jgi:hypothetical protein
MAVSSSSAPRRRWFWRLTYLAALLAVAVTGALMVQLKAGSLGRFDDSVAKALPIMNGLRLSSLALLYLAWPGLLRMLSQRGLIQSGKARLLLGVRHRLLLLCVALELLVGLDVLNHLHTLLRWLLA